MPVYVEMVKNKKTGKMVEKLVEGKKQYYIRTYVNDENGNKKQITRHNKVWLGKDGFWEAQREENRLIHKKYVKFEKITVNELFSLYLEETKSKLKPSTIRKHTDNYNLHIKPYLGSKKVFELSTKDILEFHNILDNFKKNITSKKSKRELGEYKLSISFKQSIHITLVAMLNYACKYLELDKNVASIAGNFKTPKGSVKKKLNFLTQNEFNNFIKYENNKIYKDFFTILFYTGMRRGELLALTKKDINFVANTITIDKAINPKNGDKATDPKTNKSNRVIQMVSIVRDVLYEYCLNCDDSRQIFGVNSIVLSTLQRKCDKNCKSANINKNIRIHDFRHSFASLCVNSNIPIEIVSEYLGHEKISTTYDIYSHLYNNSQLKLISELNKTI